MKAKKKIQKYGELWIKIRYLIRSVTEGSYGYGEIYMKIKVSSDKVLPLNETIVVQLLL